mgnify:CR=1 FL=1
MSSNGYCSIMNERDYSSSNSLSIETVWTDFDAGLEPSDIIIFNWLYWIALKLLHLKSYFQSYRI